MPKTRKPARSREAIKPQRIGSVATQIGISASMIRAWEKVGLLRPSRDSDKSHRSYKAEDIRLLKRAVYLRRVEKLNIQAIVKQVRKEGLLGDNAPSTSASDTPPVGPRLRALRLQRGESLAAVAAAVDLSVGFLSNLERSQTSVSIPILHKLARYFGRNILDFFDLANSVGALIRPSQRRILAGGNGVQMELLSWGKIIMEPHLFRVAPGGGSHESYSHEGEEFLYLLSGRLAFTLGKEKMMLSSGDSFYFESKIPHSWHNPDKKETLILWINTPPTF